MQPEGRYGLAPYYHYPCYMCLCERTSYAPRAWFNFRPVNEAETSEAHLKFSVNSILGMHRPSAPRQFSREVQKTIQHEDSPQLPSRSSIPAKTQSRFEPYEKTAHSAPKKEIKDGLLDNELKETTVQSHKPIGKKRRKRTIFTSEQLKKLEDEFDKQQYLVGAERQQMAAALNLSETQVKIWFQNRRIKWRKENFHLYNEI